jgi:aspartate-semialdehyde dehydrogenase
MKKIEVGILGATGAVGQKFIELLAHHPWFEVAAVAASERSQGKSYKEAANWLLSSPLPPSIAALKVQPCDTSLRPKLLFSALDSSVAGEIEESLKNAGYTIISNARNHRFHEDVPLLVPEVNGDHIQLLKAGSGRILTVPNCSTVGLCMALKPLLHFGIESVNVVTMQAISGAGYPGVASLDIMDNVIPFISGEEAKMESEPLKILGRYHNNKIVNANIKISAHCNRVPVSDGHTECVSVKFTSKPSPEEMIHAWNNFPSLSLPTAPLRPTHYHPEERFPQPKIHRNLDKGMTTHIGRLRPCPLFDYKFTILSHNTVRGAAGCGILSAELLYKEDALLSKIE